MKSIQSIVVLVLLCHVSLAQTDTIVVSDFTKMMVKLEGENRMVRVRDLADHVSAGFFISEMPVGVIRICTEDPITVWVNGRFLIGIDSDCEIIKPREIFKNVTTDSVFVAIHSFSNLSALTIHEVLFQKETIVREDPGITRIVEDTFHEFVISFFIIVLFLLGLAVTRYRNRLMYLIKKTFSLKNNSYELANTQFFSEVGIAIALVLSITLAFWGIYSGVTGSIRLFEIPDSYFGFVTLLMKASGIVFGIMVIKWLLISVLSTLFGFRKMNNYQLFDFVNFGIVFIGFLVILIFFNFLLDANRLWILVEFRISLIIMSIIFIPWFALKFVNNSPHNKLLIISYLCATELIPAVLLIGWFFK